MNTLYRSALCFIAVLSLSACESASLKDINIFSSDAGEAQRQAELATANVTPMSVAQKAPAISAAPTSSVEIYDMELNPNYQRGVAAPSFSATVQPMPSVAPVMGHVGYGEAIRTGDSSVTIYGLDGGGMSYAGAENSYGTSYSSNYGQGYGQGYNQAAGQIFFKHGSSRLGSGDMRKISNLADQAKFAPVNYITVEGFASKPTQVGTDTTQAHIINLRQSMKRSEKVSKALVRKGVPGDKIKTVGWGASKATGNNRRDRRVDVVIGEK